MRAQLSMVSPGDQQYFLASLAAAEHHTRELALALLDGPPDRVAAAATDMQQAATSLSGALQRVQQGGRVDAVLAQRLRRLAQHVAQQREACLRRGAIVDRALNSIVPSARASTYAGAGNGPYGQQVRRSGAFNQLSA